MRFIIFLFVFLNPLFLRSYDNRENVKFSSLSYPISSVSKVTDKSYILFETPVSDKINVKFNAVALQGKINDPNVKFELWIPRQLTKDGTTYVDYSIIKGVSKVFPNGRFWVRFDIKSPVDSFKMVVINNGVKAQKFEIIIYEIQLVNISIKKEMGDVSVEDKSLSLPSDIPFKLIRRSDWQANPPKENYTQHTPMKITIHHTAGHYPQTYEDALSEIQFIQDYHQNAKGWIDIGYHFLIDPIGDIFEGRPIMVVGAHVANKNTNNIGISIMGNYHPPVNNEVTDNTINALVTMVKYIKTKYSIPQSEFYGHRDFSSTDCPGDILYSKIPELRKMIFSENERNINVDLEIKNEDIQNNIYNQLVNW